MQRPAHRGVRLARDHGLAVCRSQPERGEHRRVPACTVASKRSAPADSTCAHAARDQRGAEPRRDRAAGSTTSRLPIHQPMSGVARRGQPHAAEHRAVARSTATSTTVRGRRRRRRGRCRRTCPARRRTRRGAVAGSAASSAFVGGPDEERCAALGPRARPGWTDRGCATDQPGTACFSPTHVLQHAARAAGGAAGLLVGAGHARHPQAVRDLARHLLHDRGRRVRTRRRPRPPACRDVAGTAPRTGRRPSRSVRLAPGDQLLGILAEADQQIGRHLVAAEHPRPPPATPPGTGSAGPWPCRASSGGARRRRVTPRGCRSRRRRRRATRSARLRSAGGSHCTWIGSSGTASLTARTHRARWRAPRSVPADVPVVITICVTPSSATAARPPRPARPAA